jgi:hypothetical protein
MLQVSDKDIRGLREQMKNSPMTSSIVPEEIDEII